MTEKDRASEIELSLKDVEITYFKSSGPGGQKKNKTESAVRLKHTPTGIIVVATESRSQHTNKELAFERLRQKLQKRMEKPKPRLKTRPPKAAKEERLKNKKQRADIKTARKKPNLSGD